MRVARRHVLVVAVTICGALPFGGLPSVAAAHVSKQRFGWYWHAGTYKNRAAVSNGRQLDPLNILWYGVGSSTYHEAVASRVENDWGGGGKMGEHRCLGQSGAFRWHGRQIAVFRSDNGSGRAADETDWQLSTSRGCRTQWHMRFWDDLEHFRNTSHAIPDPHPDSYTWAVSGVHYETSNRDLKVIGFGHTVRGYWSDYRNYAVNRAMKSHCGRSRWRMYPGADRNFQGRPYDGYIARVQVYDYDQEVGGCPNGLY